MITAVDTSVLIDIFAADNRYGAQSSEAIRKGIKEGNIIACSVVWAEVCAAFDNSNLAKDAFGKLGVAFSFVDESSAMLAGTLFTQYKRFGGSRSRIVPDFLIGSHALINADRLLTRDRGFYRQYFIDLEIWDPSA